MYQIYNQPTKFPLCQGQVVRKYRQVHDRQMKRTMRKQHSAIDDQLPSHFPLRFSQHSRRVSDADIKRENKRIVDSLLRARSDSTLKAYQTAKRNDQREKFRRRKWAVYKSEIQEQNAKMYKRIKNVKGMVIRDKNDIERRKRYFQNRKRARQNDIFAHPSPSKTKSKAVTKFPPINGQSNPNQSTQRHSASASSSMKEMKENYSHNQPKSVKSHRALNNRTKIAKSVHHKKTQRAL